MTALLASPWLALPLALLAALGMARLARLRPALAPLVVPFSFSAAALATFHVAGAAVPPRHWALAALYLPVLVLLVRSAGVAFQILFWRRQGMAPPALLESVVAVLLYGLGVGVIAHAGFGIELTPFLATSAVVGAVVGLALQDTLGNLFAGIAMHGEAPFRVGDWVKVGERDGRVEQVSWRAMRLRTWDGDTLIVPNAEVAKRAVLNYSVPREPHTRILVIGVNFQTPPNKVLATLRSLLAQVNGMPREPPPGLRIIGYHDFAIHYEIRYPFLDYTDYRRVEGEIFRLIWYHFQREGIEIPFPIRNVYLHQVEAGAEREDAARARLQRALRQIDLLRPLREEDLAMVASRCRHLKYAAGEEIIGEGDSGASFFVIDAGEVVVTKVIGGKVRALARLREGQFFGEMALLTGAQRTATVTAASDVAVFTIDRDGFRDVLTADPAIAVDMADILAKRRDALSQAEGDITDRGVTQAARDQLQQSILHRIRDFFGL